MPDPRAIAKTASVYCFWITVRPRTLKIPQTLRTTAPFRSGLRLLILYICAVIGLVLLFVSIEHQPSENQRLAFPNLTQVLTETIDGVPLHPGRRPDEIRSIDDPVFAQVLTDDTFLTPDDRVVGVHLNGVSRAYPLWVLEAREIVNDRMNNEAICVTYCPLSASTVVFRATAGQQSLTFGNAGALYECNLVLYDRQTGSLWYQIRGQAIAGKLKKTQLNTIPASVIRWADWRAQFPDSTVLVADPQTGRFFRALPTGIADVHPPPSEPAAPVSRFDPKLPPMQHVIGFSYCDRHICFIADEFGSVPQGEFRIPGTEPPLAIRRIGNITSLLAPDGTELPIIPAYWFAWHAAFPQTEIVSGVAR